MVSIPTQKSRPMSKNAPFRRLPARDLVICLALAAGFSTLACRSTTTSKCGPESSLAGSEPSWCDWEILERSGPEPKWKNTVSNDRLEFCGEGFGLTEQEAREDAEANMRAQAARYLETRIDSKSLVVIEGERERGASRTQASTDRTVSNMAVNDTYWERRTRIGYHHGEKLQAFGYRVLVRGMLPRQ